MLLLYQVYNRVYWYSEAGHYIVVRRLLHARGSHAAGAQAPSRRASPQQAPPEGRWRRKNQGLSWADAGGPARGWAGPGRSARPTNFDKMGRGPARPIKFSEDGPRPGPAHHIFKNSRPGPAHHFFKRLGPARPGPSHGSEAHETRALYGPARQLRGPARGFDGPAHVLFRTKTCMYTLR